MINNDKNYKTHIENKNRIITSYKCINPTCSNIIVFRERDREFFIKQGWVNSRGEVNMPKRCRSCRLEYKKQRELYDEKNNKVKPINYR
jgi:hypothetical protein